MAYSYEFKFAYTHFIFKEKHLSFSLCLKLSNVLAVTACVSVCFPIVELDYVDWFGIAPGSSGCQVSCGISPEWDCQLK